MAGILSTSPGFVHRINPVLFELGPISLYYYGLAYAVGFLGIYLWLEWRRGKTGWTTDEVCEFSIIFAACVLVFGRAFEIVVYEWEYYSMHLLQLLSYWRGGMASHGVLLGAIVGIALFSRVRRKGFLHLADEVAIPAAVFLGLGRIGNFINGQIYGGVTNVWWAVRFPDAEGFRHPVALYESLKNFMIVPILLLVRRRSCPGEGKLLAHFVLWYGFLRLFTDHFREYGTEILGVGTGQYFNLLMTVSGLGLIVWFAKAKTACRATVQAEGDSPKPSSFQELRNDIDHWQEAKGVCLKRTIFAALLLFALTIPSAWTQGVLKQYRDRSATRQVTPTAEQPTGAALR